jgi:hypothetical protein
MSMFIQGASENQDVIEIDRDNSLYNKVLEDLIHHSLECHWTIGETKVHYQGLKEALVGVEWHLPLVTLSDTDIIVSLVHIELGEIVCALEAMD